MDSTRFTSNSKASDARPYLTMVTPSRNDDYGGGMVPRLQFSLDILFEQLEKYKIESELILVDYNPPQDRKSLKDALRFPRKSEYISVRILEVPLRFHKRWLYYQHSPIHRSQAMNVGLSRARGQFSVVRMSDIIWSEELLSFIGSKNLEKNTKYRCTRCDVDRAIMNYPNWPVSRNLDYCKANTTTRMVKMKYYVKGLPALLLNSDGDFQLLSTENFMWLRGYWETEVMNSPNVDGLFEFCAFAAGVKDNLLKDVYIYKIEHDEAYKRRVLLTIPFFDKLGRFIPTSFFGPFFIKAARILGLTRIFYDKRMMKIRGIPQPTRSEYYDMCKKIIDHEISYVLNGPDWGLSDERIEEYVILKAAWDV